MLGEFGPEPTGSFAGQINAEVNSMEGAAAARRQELVSQDLSRERSRRDVKVLPGISAPSGELPRMAPVSEAERTELAERARIKLQNTETSEEEMPPSTS